MIPSGLLGCLAIVVAVEIVIARVDGDQFTTSVVQSWRATGRAAQRDAKDCDVLMFGDSAVKFGISPRVLEAELGIKAFNLAPYGGPPPASYVLLRRALAAGARPKAVVVDAMPHLLAVSPTHMLRPWQEIATPRECLDLALSVRDTSFFAQLVLGRMLPCYRDREEIRQSVKMSFRGEKFSNVIAYWVTPNRRNWRLNRGCELRAENPGFADGEITDRNSLVPQNWTCDHASLRYWNRFLTLCENHSVAVFWLIPPLSPNTQEKRRVGGHDAQYDEFVRLTLKHHPAVKVLDARQSGYERSVFMDHVHLSRRGNMALSLDTARVLRARPSEVDTWTVLPLFRFRPEREGLEDLERSRVVAMEELAKRVR
jgi:hypothetical protein